MSLVAVVKRPTECESSELDAFVAMVEAGEEVDSAELPSRVRKAVGLAFIRDGEKLVGVGGLKSPSRRRTAAAFSAAKATDSPHAYKYELGWVVIAPSHRNRRLSRTITASLVELAGKNPIFATSAESRVAMHRTLVRCGFARHGESYPSSRRDAQLLLFVRR